MHVPKNRPKGPLTPRDIRESSNAQRFVSPIHSSLQCTRVLSTLVKTCKQAIQVTISAGHNRVAQISVLLELSTLTRLPVSATGTTRHDSGL